MRRAALVLAVALSGVCSACAVPLPQISAAGTGAAASWLAMADSGVRDADAVLAADRPLKQTLCERELPGRPVDPDDWMRVWCAHLPGDVAGLVGQWAAVAAAAGHEGKP